MVDDQRKNLIYLRCDSIGDAVLAGGLLETLRGALHAYRFTAVCERRVAPLYEACPHVDQVIAFERGRFVEDEAYRSQIVSSLRAASPEIVLNTVYSREPIGDFLAGASGAASRIGHRGDCAVMSAEQRAAGDARYTHLVENDPAWLPETHRHAEFLRALGVTPPAAGTLAPRVWTTADDARFAEELLHRHNLAARAARGSRLVALFPGAQFAIRHYSGYGLALAEAARQFDLCVVALGTADEWYLAEQNLQSLRDRGVDDDRLINVSGKTTIRQSAEIVRRCALAVGSESALAHLACAVGTRNVILLGGGHFGRFMPYSPLTSIVALPLECFGCNWSCRYDRPYCVLGVHPKLIAAAVQRALTEPPADRPRVYLHGRSLWPDAAGRPGWAWTPSWIEQVPTEIVTVDVD